MSFLRALSRDSHRLSKWSGDAAAYQSGGAPRLIKRVGKRVATRRIFALIRSTR